MKHQTIQNLIKAQFMLVNDYIGGRITARQYDIGLKNNLNQIDEYIEFIKAEAVSDIFNGIQGFSEVDDITLDCLMTLSNLSDIPR